MKRNLYFIPLVLFILSACTGANSQVQTATAAQAVTAIAPTQRPTEKPTPTEKPVEKTVILMGRGPGQNRCGTKKQGVLCSTEI